MKRFAIPWTMVFPLSAATGLCAGLSNGVDQPATSNESVSQTIWIQIAFGGLIFGVGWAAAHWWFRAKEAEESAWKLSGRLIHAQEDERRRIARDLHDDLNQRLALLSVEMELLGRTPPDRKEELDSRLEQAAVHIRELSAEVHKLSYRLHPAKLDQLGLVAAARSFCRETAQQSGVAIQFSQDHVPRELSPETALCLYRVMQEALQNIVKHSGAKESKVSLQSERGALRLSITDSGAGFDLNLARQKSGLGLISMEERVRLVRGVLKIDSRPGGGTRINVSIPLSRATDIASIESF